jgi:inner membrane protein YidH
VSGRRRWYEEGADPDRRYSLANERTFLAWIRTALGLVAGAVAVVQFAPPFSVPGARLVLGLALAVTGVATAGLGYTRWKASEVALRRAERPPGPRPVQLLAAAVAVIGTLVLLLALVDALGS